MKRLYCADSLPAGQLVLDLLRRAGVEAHLFNANAAGGVGEIPFTHAYPEIWVADERDWGRAKALVEAFEASPAEAGSTRCPHCSEENPANFGVCWNCGGEL